MELMLAVKSFLPPPPAHKINFPPRGCSILILKRLNAGYCAPQASSQPKAAWSAPSCTLSRPTSASTRTLSSSCSSWGWLVRRQQRLDSLLFLKNFPGDALCAIIIILLRSSAFIGTIYSFVILYRDNVSHLAGI